MRLSFFAMLLVGQAICFADLAGAEAGFKTRYVYYDVSGDSAADIYDAMRADGPEANGERAYAATVAQPAPSGRLEQGSTCRVKDYHYDITFTIRLPHLVMQGVPADLVKRWNAFAAFLKQHEETHRSIWIACTRDITAKVSALSADSCSEVDALAKAIIDATEKTCKGQHAAFDANEQMRLSKHPFIKLTLSHAHRFERATLDTRPAKRRHLVRKNFN